ncbi:MAG: TRAP transporter small permease [Notoacmeibacter sp.]|nr:TRAP transporter small permease [Notoacmeibacter sp.]
MTDRVLRRGNGAIVRAARLLVWLSGAALIVMSVVITIEALMRKFIGQSFGGVDEITSYVFAITTTFALPFAILQRANIRIDIVRNFLPGYLRLALDILAWAAFTIVFGIIAYRACGLAWGSWLDGARSITPLRSYLAIPQGLWALGLVAGAATSAWIAVWALTLAFSGRKQAAAAVLSPADEIAQELSSINAIVAQRPANEPAGELS